MALRGHLFSFVKAATCIGPLEIGQSPKINNLLARRAHSSGPRAPLIDSFGRIHNYLRLSLTERCNLRCKYCMPADGIELTRRELSLSLEELKRLGCLLVKFCGINKIRLTGGEPLLDWRLEPLLQYLNELRPHGLETVAITTNGLLLKKKARKLRDMGLDSINISLDSLNDQKFALMTRRPAWDLAHQGLMSALQCDFMSVKVNCVVIRGFNDDELSGFADMARNFPIEIRFIELMPFEKNGWTPGSLVSSSEILAHLKQGLPSLELQPPKSVNDVSRVYKQVGMLGSIGFISSMTENFCSGCNRLRITADGNLKVCLFGKEETSLRDLIRRGSSDIEIVAAIQGSLSRKWKHHGGPLALQQQTMRPMIKIGARMYHGDGCDRFSHLDSEGRATMVNIGEKPTLKRIAIAEGSIVVGERILLKLAQGRKMIKGDILSVSRIAGILGAKMTSQLVPLCHQIALDHVQIDIKPCEQTKCLIVTARVETNHSTGVEMESLMGVSITLLTLYDMCKSDNKSMVITGIRLVSKRKIIRS